MGDDGEHEGDPDPLDPFLDDFDEEEFVAAWEEADRQAAEVLRTALMDVDPVAIDTEEIAAAASSLREAVAGRDRDARWMVRAAGITEPGEVGDEVLLIEAVAATISMVDEPGLPAEEAASIMTLELADWVGAIIGLVRAGPGADASPAALVDYAEDADEVAAAPLEPNERDIIEHSFRLVLPAWRAAGVVEARDVPVDVDEHRLTRLGAWLLPAAAAHAWTGGELSAATDDADILAFPTADRDAADDR